MVLAVSTLHSMGKFDFNRSPIMRGANHLCVVVVALVILITLDIGSGMGIGYQGLEENCILSFVVPKEKMKSSCDLDEKIRRRINAMEMKVNIYKQQVSELQMQQEKQRRADAGKLEKLEQQVRDNSVNADMSFLIERRLALLEKEFEQLHEQMRAGSTFRQYPSSKGKTSDMASDDHNLGSQYAFNALDRNPVTLPNLVKSMVRAEVKSMFDNFTKKFEAYVQEQILLYNQVFRMLAKRGDSALQPGRGGTFSSDREERPDRGEKETVDDEEAIFREFENIKVHFADTGHEITKQVAEMLRNRTKKADEERNLRQKPSEGKGKDSTADSVSKEPTFNEDSDYKHTDTVRSDAVDRKEENQRDQKDTLSASERDVPIIAEITLPDSSELVLEAEILDANDTFSGDNGDTNETARMKPENYDENENFLISTRIGHGPDLSKDNSSARPDYKDGANEGNSIHRDWKDNMIMDENKKNMADDRGLLERFENMIQSQLATAVTTVLSEIKKRTSALEEKMQIQEERSQIVTKDISSHLKELDKETESINIRVDALSQGFQDSLVKLEKIKTLDIMFTELKKNVSSYASSSSLELSPLEFDEQSKKVKKLERLMAIYQQSLEHYRNETKHEYRDIKESLELEATNMKTATKSLHDDVETIVSSAISKLNDTYNHKLQTIDDQIRMHEENVVLMQVDLSSFERMLNSKSSRSDRELEDITSTLDHLSDRHRNINKKYDRLERAQADLVELVNTTANEVSNLKFEVKLSVLDEWLPLSFDFDTSRTECFGDQYVKRTAYTSARYVGVVLCSRHRYKIFLSSSLDSQFLNIGDGRGMGEDHCEFVGAKQGTAVTLSEFKGSYKAHGWTRSHWGEEPTTSFLNTIKPSPHWYECGVSIP